MFVILLAAALFYPAHTCSSNKDDIGTFKRDLHNILTVLDQKAEERLMDGSNTTEDRRHTLSQGPRQEEQGIKKRQNSDELSAKRNEILRLAYELPPLFNYYDILGNENDLMENKWTHGLPPKYLSYPRYFGYKF